MLSTRTQSTPESKPSFFNRITSSAAKRIGQVVGIISGLPNTQYAMTVSYYTHVPLATAKDVTWTWLTKLPGKDMAGAIFNGFSTQLVSGTFGCKFLPEAFSKMYSEASLYYHKKISHLRFWTEYSLSFLSAITGASISGGPYEDLAVRRFFQAIGFVTIGSLSFLGMNELLIKLTDENYAIKMKVIACLKRANPDIITRLLKDKDLNEENLSQFLNALFELNVAKETQLEIIEVVIRAETDSERRIALCKTIIDYILSGFLAFCCNTIYTQSGYSGLNTLSAHSLDQSNLTNGEKIAIGIIPGIPLTLFALFTMKFLQSPLFDKINEIINDPVEILKLFSLAAFCIGNAMWYQGLATDITNGDNIYSSYLESDFGQYVFPWAAFVTAFNMGLNGLLSLVFPVTIKPDDTEQVKAIKCLEHNLVPISDETLQGLKRFAMFGGERKPVAEVKSIPEIKVVANPIIS